VAVHGAAKPRAGHLSNREAITPRGKVRAAITSGSANVSRIYQAPSGKVYVLFTQATQISGGEPTGNKICDDDSGTSDDEEFDDSETRAAGDDGEDEDVADDEEDSGDDEPVCEDELTPVVYCLLAELDPTSREPTCIEQTFWSIRNSTFRGVNESIQFDDQGAVYYMGYGWDYYYGSSYGFVLRRYLDGQKTDVIRDRYAVLDDDLVMPGGDVLVSGATTSSGSRWVRRIEPSGRVHSVWSRSASFLRLFPDGNAYLGHDTGGGAPGVERMLGATGQLDPDWRMDAASLADVCAGADQSTATAFCEPAGSRMTKAMTTSDGRVFAIAGTGDGGRLVQYHPEVRIVPSAVRRVSVAEVIGDAVLLAGVDDHERRVLVLLDTVTDQETTIIGPDQEVDVYHLAVSADAGKLRFDGLRFADARYVLGEIDLATGAISFLDESRTEWTALEALG
jgi:hypothetical protein